MTSSSSMLVVGLTGGIASGKSTVLHYLRKKRLPVLCADHVAHETLKRTGSAYKKVVQFFGKEILDSKKEINRQKLGALVFTNPQKLKILNDLVHPCVMGAFKKKLASYQKAGKKLVILDVPLLFETGFDSLCHTTLVVYATQKQQKERMRLRNQWSANEINQRLKAQWPLKKKVKLSDSVIKNTGSLNNTYHQVDQWLDFLKQKKGGHYNPNILRA